MCTFELWIAIKQGFISFALHYALFPCLKLVENCARTAETATEQQKVIYNTGIINYNE